MKFVVKKLVYALVTVGLIAGCSDEEPVAFEKTFVDKRMEHALEFNKDLVDIRTPSGSITKPFAIKGKQLELHYSDPLGKENDILLTFQQDETEMELYCKKCAKYQLPSRWYLDVLNSKSL